MNIQKHDYAGLFERRDMSVPKQRGYNTNIQEIQEKNIITERGIILEENDDQLRHQSHSISDFGFTSKLEGISERNSSDYAASKISSGLGGQPMSKIEGKIAMDALKMKEIRQYVAHELYRSQKRIDESYKEFEKIQKTRKDLMKQNTQAALLSGGKDRGAADLGASPENEQVTATKQAIKNADVQFEKVRKQLKNY